MIPYQSHHDLPHWHIWLFVLAAVLVFFMNYPVVYNLRISHLVIFTVLARAIFYDRYYLSEYFFLFTAILLAGISIVHNLYFTPSSHNLFSESIKLVLLLVGTVFVNRSAGNHIHLFFHYLVPVSVVAVLWNYSYGDWGYYDAVRMRFGIPMLGSPNSTAYVLSFITITALVMAKDEINHRKHIFWLFSSAVLTSAIVLSQSRGGLIILLAGLITVFKFNRYTISIIILSLISIFLYISPADIQRLNVINDIASTGGTGRLEIWRQLILSLLANPGAFILGYGPGSIEVYVKDSVVISAHSSFVSLLYWYGLVGLLLSLCYIGALTWKILKFSSPLAKGFATMMIISLMRIILHT